MTNQSKAKLPTLATKWTVRTYDVWGNARDGYDVNDSYDAGTVELRIPQRERNPGTPQSFVGACPADRQIKKAFGIRCRIETEGDDVYIMVNRARDGYPIGELLCESHESLSPVRKAEEAN